MLERIKGQFQAALNKSREWLSKTEGLSIPPSVIKTFLVILAVIIAGFVIIRLFEALFTSFKQLIDRHPVGVGATAVGAGFFGTKLYQIREESKRRMAEQQRGWDTQKKNLYRGCYEVIATWLYTHVCGQSTFEDLTSLRRPIRPEDFGDKDRDVYLYDGLAHFRFSIPKSSVEPLNIRHVTSVLQGMIQQQLRIYGMSPILQKADCNKLLVKEVQDLNTVVFVTLILDWDDIYLKQKMYENTMAEVEALSAPETFDNDYHS